MIQCEHTHTHTPGVLTISRPPMSHCSSGCMFGQCIQQPTVCVCETVIKELDAVSACSCSLGVCVWAKFSLTFVCRFTAAVITQVDHTDAWCHQHGRWFRWILNSLMMFDELLNEQFRFVNIQSELSRTRLKFILEFVPGGSMFAWGLTVQQCDEKKGCLVLWSCD